MTSFMLCTTIKNHYLVLHVASVRLMTEYDDYKKSRKNYKATENRLYRSRFYFVFQYVKKLHCLL